MEDGQLPAKRPKYNLTDTFDVVVGKAPSSQRFTVYSNFLTSRSGFFKAARKPEWLTDPSKPVDLQNEDAEAFSRYLNCAYFGADALQIRASAPEDDRAQDKYKPTLLPDAFVCSEAEHTAAHEKETESRGKYLKYLHQCLGIFTDLYLLADRLRDLQTANLVMDELVRFSAEEAECFDEEDISRVYNATAHGNPLRKLMRDECVYEQRSGDYMDMHVQGNHPEFTRDVLVESMRLKDYNGYERVNRVYRLTKDRGRFIDKCHYHQHNETYPRCVPEPKEERESSPERPHEE